MKHHVSDRSGKSILWLIGGFTVLALVLIGFVALGEQKLAQGVGRVTQYRSEESEKPIASFETVTKDLGTMKVSEEKSESFPVKNTGTKPLSLFNISSSCGCTFGQITINGVKSPESAMHSKNSWVGTLNPGEEGIVSVIYRPSIMPVKGDVTRTVYVETNDPANTKLSFNVKAFIE